MHTFPCLFCSLENTLIWGTCLQISNVNARRAGGESLVSFPWYISYCFSVHQGLMSQLPTGPVHCLTWKLLMTKKDEGPQFSTSSIVTSDHTNSATRLYDTNWKLSSTTELVRSRARGWQGSYWRHSVPCFLLFLGREGPQGQAAVSPTCPCLSLPACLCVGELSAALCTM